MTYLFMVKFIGFLGFDIIITSIFL